MRALRGADPPLSLPPSSDMVVNPVLVPAAQILLGKHQMPQFIIGSMIGSGAGLTGQMCFRGKGQ